MGLWGSPTLMALLCSYSSSTLMSGDTDEPFAYVWTITLLLQ